MRANVFYLFGTLFNYRDMYYLVLREPGSREITMEASLTRSLWRLGRAGWQLMSLERSGGDWVYWLQFAYETDEQVERMQSELTGTVE